MKFKRFLNIFLVTEECNYNFDINKNLYCYFLLFFMSFLKYPLETFAFTFPVLINFFSIFSMIRFSYVDFLWGITNFNLILKFIVKYGTTYNSFIKIDLSFNFFFKKNRNFKITSYPHHLVKI